MGTKAYKYPVFKAFRASLYSQNLLNNILSEVIVSTYNNFCEYNVSLLNKYDQNLSNNV